MFGLYDPIGVLGVKGTVFLCRQWRSSVDRLGVEYNTVINKSQGLFLPAIYHQS